MADRELLELAAKAAGIKVLQRGDGYWTIEVYERGMRGWNPLIDDGDALRLASKCLLGIEWKATNVRAYGISPGSHVGVGPVEMYADHGNDMAAATRRAIVRAAAEIGRTMP